ncbi:MAG: hypothetical protein L6R40_004024 [Gallowayella cf. fulva]|nr:MAG: hypothetical protein L6R40_004024 [Xanthomendoza cf. fulva]
MFALASFIRRNYEASYPKEVPKQSTAVRFGLLGATDIAPLALITPAKSHPEVIIAAVAARDEKRARSYAKRYKIPIVHPNYQALLDDSAIDAVYIALPNAHHYEWATKALEAGKHVLLEKPSVSNADEAAKLFRHPMLSKHGGPVLLEAMHFRFHPAWQKLLSLIDLGDVVEAHSTQYVPKGIIPLYGNQCKYSLAGGCLMRIGTYNIASLRQLFGAEPEDCLDASFTRVPPGNDKEIDQAFCGKWKFRSGAIGSIEVDMMADGGYSWPLTSEFPTLALPKLTIKHREVVVESELPTDQEHVVTKTVTMWNWSFAFIYHRIDIEEKHTVRSKSDGKTVKDWLETSYVKEYSGKTGTDSWTSYRYQLEEFLNKVRERPGSGVWVEGEDSVNQMKMIDDAYIKAGLPVRPSLTKV